MFLHPLEAARRLVPADPSHSQPIGAPGVRGQVLAPREPREPRKWNLLLGPGRPVGDVLPAQQGDESVKLREILVRREGRGHRPDLRALFPQRPEPVHDRPKGVRPECGFSVPTHAERRLVNSVGAIQPLVSVPAVVAHPEPVHIRIFAGPKPVDEVVPGVQLDVAAL